MFVQCFMYVEYSGVLNTFIAFIMAFCYQQSYFKFPAVVWVEMGTFSRE